MRWWKSAAATSTRWTSPPRGRPHVTLTVPWEALKDGAGVVDVEGGPVSVEAARRLTCDASLTPLVAKDGAQPMQAGRTRRVVPPAMQPALDLRDGGCTHPGCDVPARWCDAHHITHWAHGGPTTLGNPGPFWRGNVGGCDYQLLGNLCLLCRHHHRQAHDHQQYPRRL
jgi:hypothetical protein